jgi:hypothetical protein
MKTIEVSPQAIGVSEILAQARDEDVLVKTSDGEEFLVSAVDEFGHEIAKTRQNSKLMTLLDERGRQTKTVSLSEVKRQLGLSN